MKLEILLIISPIILYGNFSVRSFENHHLQNNLVQEFVSFALLANIAKETKR